MFDLLVADDHYRHTYGALLAAEGTLVADLRGLMGYASLATTQG